MVQLDVLENLGTQGNYSIVEPNEKLKEGTALELYAAEHKMRGSVTKFEKFNKCPFQYFADYGLRLKERREYKLKALDVGNILHAIMKQFGEDLQKAEVQWREVDTASIESHVTKILDELTPNVNNKILLSSKTLEHQRDRIKKVAVASLQRLVELDRHSQFHPEIFEATFAALAQKVLVYDLDGVKLELVGKIDRIDFSEDGNYFLIIDYKTGKAYLNLWEIYLGVNLQLLTYLMATNNLRVVENRLPAAMLYFLLKYPTTKGDTFNAAKNQINRDLKMEGFVLDEDDVARKIDETLAIVPTKSDSKRSGEQFEILIEYVEDCLKATGKKILSGNIATAPVKTKSSDACKYCGFAEICRLDKKANIPIKPPLDDNEIFEKMKAHEVNT